MGKGARDPQTSNARAGRAPGPQGSRVLGNLPEIRRHGPLEHLVDAWRRHGDVVRFRMGPDVVHLLAHPDDVEHVLASNKQNFQRGTIFERRTRPILGNSLVTTEGALWEQQRQLIEPLLGPDGVSEFADIMVVSAERVMKTWTMADGDGAVVDIHHEMLQVTMRVIYQAVFGQDLGDSAAEIERAFAFFVREIPRRVNQLVTVPLFVPTPSNRELIRKRRVVDRVVEEGIASRRHSGKRRHDLLSLLLAARDKESGRGMSDQQLRDEVLTIFAAGQETTALALTWAWYLLSQHPEVERTLHAELGSVLGGRIPTAADVPNLPYTRHVFWETLRLYPPAWGFMQKALRADEIGGFEIPAGSIIVLSPYITHRHPAIWEHAEMFDPDRMARERAGGLPRYAFFPFGGGRHKCIGREFATLEAQLVLAMIAQRYRLRLTTAETVPATGDVTLRPAHPIRMALEPR